MGEMEATAGIMHYMSHDLLDACEAAPSGGLLVTSVKDQVTCPACRKIIDKAEPVTSERRLSVNGSTSIVVTPPRPCGLGDCVAELAITIRYDTIRAHLSSQQRRELIEALGGHL